MVGRSDILGSCSDPQHSLRLESRHSRQHPFLIFAVFWAIGALLSNWRSQTGDYAKARRAVHTSQPGFSAATRSER